LTAVGKVGSTRIFLSNTSSISSASEIGAHTDVNFWVIPVVFAEGQTLHASKVPSPLVATGWKLRCLAVLSSLLPSLPQRLRARLLRIAQTLALWPLSLLHAALGCHRSAHCPISGALDRLESGTERVRNSHHRRAWRILAGFDHRRRDKLASTPIVHVHAGVAVIGSLTLRGVVFGAV